MILSFAKIRTGRLTVDSQHVERQNPRVLEMIFVLVRALALTCRGHHELVLENLALRLQIISSTRRFCRSACSDATITRPALIMAKDRVADCGG